MGPFHFNPAPMMAVSIKCVDPSFVHFRRWDGQFLAMEVRRKKAEKLDDVADSLWRQKFLVYMHFSFSQVEVVFIHSCAASPS